MTSPLTDQQIDDTTSQELSIRPVIEHALTNYGYSPATARTLIDRLIAEDGDE